MTGADLAIVAASFLSILTLIAFKRLTSLPQSIQKRYEQPTALGEGILDVGRIAAEIRPLKQLVLYHVTQATHESTTTYGFEIGVQLHCSFWAGGQISDNQHRPLVADHLQCAGNRTTIEISPSHS